MGVLPAIPVLFAAASSPAAAPTAAVGVLLGALFMMGVVRLARLRATPDPIALRDSVVHASLLALGCCLLLLLGQWWGLSRLHWALLALCLMLVPGMRSTRSALRYAGATALGAFGAVLLSLPGPPTTDLVLLILAMVATVALTLADRKELSVIPLAATVVLLGSVLSGEHTLALGLQRAGMALLALGVGAGLLLVSSRLPAASRTPLSRSAASS